MKHLTEEQLVLYHFGENPGRGEMVLHLESCGLCRSDYEALRRTLDLASMLPVPERDEAYGRDVWRRLQPRLNPPHSRRVPLALRQIAAWMRATTSFRGWAFTGGLAAALCVAFFAGRSWPDSARNSRPLAEHSHEPVSPAARERVLLVEIGDHLDRAQSALIELINSETNSIVDITLEQSMARQLVDVNRLYRRTAAARGESGMASVLEDLERALLEISHSPPQLSSAEFAEFRQRIDTEGMLFKVRVFGAGLRAEEKVAAHKLGGQTIGL